MLPVPRRPTAWAHVRAALLLSVLLINFCQGFPVPQIEEKHVERPSGRRQLARWGGILRGLGVEITDEELRDQTLEASKTIGQWHGALLAPVMPAFHQTQIRQRWSLFTSSDPNPWWLHIEGRFAGEEDFRLLWRPMDSEADTLQFLFEYRRLRGVWNPGAELRPDHPRFVRFTFNTLFERFPELDEVRLRFMRFHVHRPGEPANDHIEWRWEARDRRADSERAERDRTRQREGAAPDRAEEEER